MERVKDYLVMLVLVLVVVMGLIDLSKDFSHGTTSWHLLGESLLVLLSAAVIVWLARSLRQQRIALEQLKREISSPLLNGAGPGREVQEARHRLSEVIQQQFQQWKLTDSEQEVAMLLLRGLSFREIAAVRNTLEKTYGNRLRRFTKKPVLLASASVMLPVLTPVVDISAIMAFSSLSALFSALISVASRLPFASK